MTHCRYCKKTIQWKQVKRKYPKKIYKEIDGVLSMVYDDLRWQTFNEDGTEHRCVR
jgi:hypothetical protein